MIRRSLTWDERLTLAEWYLNRIDLRTCGKVGDTATRNKMIVFLLGTGQSKESVAASFNISVGTVTRVLNRLQREHGVQVAAGKSAAKR